MSVRDVHDENWEHDVETFDDEHGETVEWDEQRFPAPPPNGQDEPKHNFAKPPVPVGLDDITAALVEADREGRPWVVTEETGGDAATDNSDRARYSDGGAFILEAPAHPTVVWGDDDHVLWVQGEPFLLVAPQGVGKTTIAAQLTFARVGLLPDVLGLPVVDTGGHLLYLACDRAA
jgi:hypothetical protein